MSHKTRGRRSQRTPGWLSELAKDAKKLHRSVNSIHQRRAHAQTGAHEELRGATHLGCCLCATGAAAAGLVSEELTRREQGRIIDAAQAEKHRWTSALASRPPTRRRFPNDLATIISYRRAAPSTRCSAVPPRATASIRPDPVWRATTDEYGVASPARSAP